MFRLSNTHKCSKLKPSALAVSPIPRAFSRFSVPKAKILLPSRALITEAAAILDKTRVRLPESQHSVDAETAWSTWMEQELSSKLRGLTAGTVRAQVRIVNVRSAEVHKGMIRAEEVSLVLDLEGAHSKEVGSKMNGVVRAVLKTEDNKDQLSISDAIWDPDHSTSLSKEVQADINATAKIPLESALAARLNDLLWDVERRSIDESMDE